MLTLITHGCGILELVEAPDAENPCRAVAPWENVVTRPDGSHYVTRDGVNYDLETYVCEHTGETRYQTVAG